MNSPSTSPLTIVFSYLHMYACAVRLLFKPPSSFPLLSLSSPPSLSLPPFSPTPTQRSARDAISERSDAHFVAKVRDDVINELEVQKQFATAYSIWLEQQHHEGIIRRGIKSIRRSFRRSRGDSASRSREGQTKTKLQGKCDFVLESGFM